MTRILISGGHGQLGQALTQQATHLHLISLGHQELDVTQRACLERALDRHQADIVINAAAYTAVDNAETDVERAYRVNAIAPGLMASVCAERGIQMLHLSTDYVFDGLAAQPYAEDAPTNPISVYGHSKREGEQAVLRALPSALILRTSRVFSPFGNNFLTRLLTLAQERSELSLVDDQTSGPTYAPHLARIVLQLTERLLASSSDTGSLPLTGIVHFSGLPCISWYGFAQEIIGQAVKLGLLGTAPTLTPIPASHYPTPARRPAQSGLQQDRVDALLGKDTIERDWRKGIEHSLFFLQKAR